jgi:hypothetical protein
MTETEALVRLEPLKPLNAAALPKYFTRALAERRQIRSIARTTAIGEGVGALFYAFITCAFSYMTGALWNYGLLALFLLSAVTAVVATGACVIAAKEGWACFERIGFLRGTRDEAKYLPAGCREGAEREASLIAAFDEVEAAAARWNASLPLLEAHGTPKLLAIAADNREKLEARRATVVQEVGRLWGLAGRSTGPIALAAPSEPKRLKSADS